MTAVRGVDKVLVGGATCCLLALGKRHALVLGPAPVGWTAEAGPAAAASASEALAQRCARLGELAVVVAVERSALATLGASPRWAEVEVRHLWLPPMLNPSTATAGWPQDLEDARRALAATIDEWRTVLDTEARHEFEPAPARLERKDRALGRRKARAAAGVVASLQQSEDQRSVETQLTDWFRSSPDFHYPEPGWTPQTVGGAELKVLAGDTLTTNPGLRAPKGAVSRLRELVADQIAKSNAVAGSDALTDLFESTYRVSSGDGRLNDYLADGLKRVDQRWWRRSIEIEEGAKLLAQLVDAASLAIALPTQEGMIAIGIASNEKNLATRLRPSLPDATAVTYLPLPRPLCRPPMHPRQGREVISTADNPDEPDEEDVPPPPL